MAFCPNCGAQNDNALKFCSNCGTALGAQPQVQQPQVQQPQAYAQPQQQQPYMQPQAYAQPQVQQPYAPAPPPAKKKSKAPLVIVALVVVAGLVAAGIFTNGFGLFGGGKGGAITVYGITGNNAALAGGQAVKPGAELKAGSRLETGAATCVYLKVAEDSILKMDEYSEISLSEISGGVLKFDLVKGSVLVNENGPEGRVQMTAGNTLLIVRGTFFTANYDGGDMVVDLIEGEIDVKTDSGSVTNVEQGRRVTVIGDEDAVVDALDVSLFDAFTMDSVMEYKNVLTDGSLSEMDFSYISDCLGGGDFYMSDGGDPISEDATGYETTTAVWADYTDGEDRTNPGGGEDGTNPGGGEDGTDPGGGEDRTGTAPDWNDGWLV